MSPIYRYFRDIYLGVTTVSIGMWVTLRHLFMPTVTVQYPHQKLSYPPRARTMLVNNIDICNGDQQCVRACPVDIIHMQVVKVAKDEDLGLLPDGKPKRLHVLKFDVEMAKCIFCGLCVEVCPTGAIHWEHPHEEVTYSREQTVCHWSKYSPEEVKRLLERDAAMKAEAAKAAAQKAVAQPAAKAAAAPTKGGGDTKAPPERKTGSDAKPETPNDPKQKDGKEDA